MTKQERRERKAMARRAALDHLGRLMPPHMFQMDYDTEVTIEEDGAWVDVRIWISRKGKCVSNKTLSIDETRRRIAALAEVDRCSPGCKGWDVFDTNTVRGTEVERCDECFAHMPDDQTVFDDDVQQLPEAIAALVRAYQEAQHG